MDELHPQPEPDGISAKGLARRRLLRHSGTAVAGLALASAGLRAQQATAPAIVAPNEAELDAFHKLSRLLTGHENLDLTLGTRLYQAMTQRDATFPATVKALGDYAAQHGHTTVEALEQALKGQPLHAPLMAIVGAWYSGVIEPGTGATVYAYERALMYQPSRDGMVIPTYAHNGPNYWVAEPPPLDRMPSF
ncbi:sorbitol dehydrogenase family protein [Frateuria defendens]|uniref:sorbitol dehydrogenase family protein n=1 Tax=Frateuria defendens TaxID=2219559 RepID=UPI00066FE823|nr:sorbitol dehydrogenase family protein [Frateuria defendens]